MNIIRPYPFHRKVQCSVSTEQLIGFVRSTIRDISVGSSSDLPKGTTFLSSIHGGFISISASSVVNRNSFSQIVAPRLLIRVVSKREPALMLMRVSAVSALSVTTACIALGCVGAALAFVFSETSSNIAFGLVLAVFVMWMIALIWWRRRHYLNRWSALANWGEDLLSRMEAAGISEEPIS